MLIFTIFCYRHLWKDKIIGRVDILLCIFKKIAKISKLKSQLTVSKKSPFFFLCFTRNGVIKTCFTYFSFSAFLRMLLSKSVLQTLFSPLYYEWHYQNLFCRLFLKWWYQSLFYKLFFLCFTINGAIQTCSADFSYSALLWIVLSKPALQLLLCRLCYEWRSLFRGQTLFQL